MSNRNAYDPDKLSNVEYKKIFGKPSPLERSMNRGKDKKKKKRRKKRSMTRKEAAIKAFQEMSDEEQRTLIKMLEENG